MKKVKVSVYLNITEKTEVEPGSHYQWNPEFIFFFKNFYPAGKP
jgi:hypothetical protein